MVLRLRVTSDVFGHVISNFGVTFSSMNEVNISEICGIVAWEF